MPITYILPRIPLSVIVNIRKNGIKALSMRLLQPCFVTLRFGTRAIQIWFLELLNCKVSKFFGDCSYESVGNFAWGVRFHLRQTGCARKNFWIWMNDRKHRARERTIKQSFGRKQLRAISLTTLGIWISHKFSLLLCSIEKTCVSIKMKRTSWWQNQIKIQLL